MMRKLGFILTATLALAACSIQRLAINSIGDALASSGPVFQSDNDPVLISEALPFSLKLIESVLAEQPDHRELLLAATRGYLLYTYAFVDIPADEARLEDIERTRLLRARARNLYLRAHSYASRALALDYPIVAEQLTTDPAAAVATIESGAGSDVTTLYWTAAALGLAISMSRNEPALLARLPEVEALLDRALALDESWEDGALHEFAMSLQRARTGPVDEAAIERHYRRAVELAKGTRAGPHVTFAEVIAVPRQDREQFTALLEQALELDVEKDPNQRLLNVIAQQHARWLLENIDEFIL
jgi:predicted anti-sigma-YlaC factor YlaD